MSTPTLGIESADLAMALFFKMAFEGLRAEDRKLLNANSSINELANSVRFAYYEVVYAYLIRRHLALKGYSPSVGFEESYPSTPSQRVDLELWMPRRDDPCCVRCGVELKWITGSDRGSVFPLIDDALKLLAERSFSQRYLLIFPLCNWDSHVEFEANTIAQLMELFSPEYAPEAPRFRATAKHQDRFSTRVKSNTINFGVALLKIDPIGE